VCVFFEKFHDGRICNLLEVIAVLDFLHIQFPTRHYPLPLSLCCGGARQIATKIVYQSRYIFIESIVGFQILIKPVDDQVGKASLLISVIDDCSAKLKIITDSSDHIFDEVIAVFETLFLEQLSSWMVQLNTKMVVRTHKLLDLPLELYFFLLFFLDEQKLLLQLSLQFCQDVPRIISTLHIINSDNIAFCLASRSIV